MSSWELTQKTNSTLKQRVNQSKKRKTSLFLKVKQDLHCQKLLWSHQKAWLIDEEGAIEIRRLSWRPKIMRFHAAMDVGVTISLPRRLWDISILSVESQNIFGATIVPNHIRDESHWSFTSTISIRKNRKLESRASFLKSN